MINVNTFKPGLTFQDGNEIFVVLESQHSKQGRGQANVKAKVKNLRTGAVVIKTFGGGEKITPAHISKKNVNFLYREGDFVIVMTQDTFEQISLPVEQISWELNFIKPEMAMELRMFGSEVLGLELPAHVELEVIEAPDAVKGNTQSNPQKKVILETNYELETPMFIKTGEKVVVSTLTGKYVGKGK